jgi:hypothetical protein
MRAALSRSAKPQIEPEHRYTFIAVLLLTTVLAGCAGKNNAKNPPATGAQPATVASPAPSLATAATAATTAIAATAGGVSPSARAATLTATPGVAGATSAPVTATAANSATQAIMAAVQQANAEQQQALARKDPSVMQDTATPSYFQALIQTQRDLLGSGVTAIKLLSLQWGQVAVQGTDAQATTTETWQTSYADGTTDQSTDLNLYTLVQQGSRWLVAGDDHPNTHLRQPAPGAPTAPRAPTAPTAPSLPPNVSSPQTGAPGADQSRNWSGYSAGGGPFTAVSGSWKVPNVDPNSSLGSADSTWVGIGGVTTDDLIQAGTQTSVHGSGRVSYSAWIETLPRAPRTVPLQVSPGDIITVTLTQQADGTWQVSMVDRTTGQSYQTSIQYNSSLSSAEWIEEAPAAVSTGVRIVTLDNFGQVQFQNATATLNGKQVTIGQTNATPITMYGRGGQLLTQLSALGSDGSSFTVTRLPSGATPNSR